MSNMICTLVACILVAVPLSLVFPPLGIGGWIMVVTIVLIDGLK